MKLLQAIGIGCAAVACAMGGAQAARGAALCELLGGSPWATSVVVAFRFDGTLEPSVTNAAWPVSCRLARSSPAYGSNGEPIAEDAPRFVRAGDEWGVLLEAGTTNLACGRATRGSDASVPTIALRGATTQADPEAVYRTQTPGVAAYEGVAFIVGGVATGVSAVTASLDIRGSGPVCLRLCDAASGLDAPPAYLDLTADWQRAILPPIYLMGIGSTQLEVRVTATDRRPAEWEVVRLQLEHGPQATSWTRAGRGRADERILIALGSNGWPWAEGTALVRAQLRWSPWSVDAGRVFLSAGRNEPGLFWTAYHSLGTVGQPGYPRVQAPSADPGAWRCMGVSWSATGVVVCMDGAVARGEKGGSWRATRELSIGLRANAVVSDFALLNRALSGDELRALARETGP